MRTRTHTATPHTHTHKHFSHAMQRTSTNGGVSIGSLNGRRFVCVRVWCNATSSSSPLPSRCGGKGDDDDIHTDGVTTGAHVDRDSCLHFAQRSPPSPHTIFARRAHLCTTIKSTRTRREWIDGGWGWMRMHTRTRIILIAYIACAMRLRSTLLLTPGVCACGPYG